MEVREGNAVADISFVPSQEFPADSTVFVELKPLIDTVGPIRDILSYSIVDVTAFNPINQPITRFEEPVKICLTVPPQTERERACLAFLNDNFEWECEDPCVSQETNADGETLFCGNTDHQFRHTVRTFDRLWPVSIHARGRGRARNFVYVCCYCIMRCCVNSS